MGNQMSNYDLALGFLQVFDVLLNLDQVSNDTILEELQKQDKEYLEKIVKQNEENAVALESLDTLARKIIEQNDRILAGQRLAREMEIRNGETIKIKEV